MQNSRDIIIVIVATTVLISGLGLYSAYRNGDISFGRRAHVEENIAPKALPSQNTVIENTTMQQNTSEALEDTKNPTVTFKTSEGDVTIELYQDLMPITASNFAELAQKNFYDGTKFHRVINGFMIQGGDPNTKTDAVATYGTGGPGYAIEDEHVSDPKLSNVRGTISMANSGPHSGGSQFFINLVDNTGLDFDKAPLTSQHPVFGRVIAGMDVVDRIAQVPTNERDMPLTPVVISAVVVKE